MTTAQFIRVAAFLDAKPTDLMSAPISKTKARRYDRIATASQGVETARLQEWLTLAEKIKFKKIPPEPKGAA